jgi:glycosyltransferase involved in cell wall biosynthesis
LGVPAIGFDIVGLSDSIENGHSGILVPFKDVNKFSEAMIELYDNPNYLEKLKLNGIKRVFKHFSADAIYFDQNEFYQFLLTVDKKKRYL